MTSLINQLTNDRGRWFTFLYIKKNTSPYLQNVDKSNVFLLYPSLNDVEEKFKDSGPPT